jgi:hypothetical protein
MKCQGFFDAMPIYVCIELKIPGDELFESMRRADESDIKKYPWAVLFFISRFV